MERYFPSFSQSFISTILIEMIKIYSLELRIIMKIIVDADACPVKKEIINIAKEYDLKVLLVMSIAHYSDEQLPSHVEKIYVEKGADRADFKIVQVAKEKDIVITQDYGLASLLLPKGSFVIHHLGYEYNHNNIQGLLDQRYLSAMERNAGKKTKGPKKFTKEKRTDFECFFKKFIEKKKN